MSSGLDDLQWAWPVVFIAVLLGGGCASFPDQDSPVVSRAPSIPMAATKGPDLRMVWRNFELHPIGQPTAIGEVVVAIVAHRRRLFLVGIDPATGATRWDQPLTPSALRTRERIRITKLGDDKIAYFRPIRDDYIHGYAELVVADVRTGVDLAKSPEARFTSNAIVCGGGAALCAITEEWNADKQALVRLEIATRKYVVENSNIPIRMRMLSSIGLFELGNRPVDTLARLRDGKLRWLTSVAAAFPRGFSSAYGWSWGLFAEQEVIVGSVGGPYTLDRERVTYDLARTAATAGFAEGTGDVLWRDRGSEHGCGLWIEDSPVRCRSRGSVTFHDGHTSFDGLDVTVEGFDPATGKTTWSVPVGAAQALAYGDPPAIAGPTRLVLNRPQGPVILDYATGATESPAPGAAFWCLADATYEVASPHWGNRRWTDDERRGGRLAFNCDDRGRPAAVLPSAAATMAAGAQVGRYGVLATRDGLVGFEAR
jgi:hypothetical protein